MQVLDKLEVNATISLLTHGSYYAKPDLGVGRSSIYLGHYQKRRSDIMDESCMVNRSTELQQGSTLLSEVTKTALTADMIKSTRNIA